MATPARALVLGAALVFNAVGCGSDAKSSSTGDVATGVDAANGTDASAVTDSTDGDAGDVTDTEVGGDATASGDTPADTPDAPDTSGDASSDATDAIGDADGGGDAIAAADATDASEVGDSTVTPDGTGPSDVADTGLDAADAAGDISDTGNVADTDGGSDSTDSDASDASGETADGDGGCSQDSDCSASPETPYCASDGSCVACIEGVATATCDGGLACCGTVCIDTDNDLANCGACGEPCSVDQGTAVCTQGACLIETCNTGFLDCDQNPDTGCEVSEAAGGSCLCTPGAVEPCYSGPDDTQGVGQCVAGNQTCNTAGTAFGPCEGEVVPAAQDDCTDTVDNDCDGVANNGFPAGVDCVCIPGETIPCYEGPEGTEGVGECTGGTQTCLPSGLGYGACEGQVVPQPEICNDGLNNDCVGGADDPPDEDGDGWTYCNGDCCDVAGPACSQPALVNPGAFEFLGNSVDDDCDGQVDNAATSCDVGLPSDSSDAVQYAFAMDLCQTTTVQDAGWGVLSGTFSLADGTGAPDSGAHAIRPGFGLISPRLGDSVGVLSTGTAAAPGDSAPNHQPFQPGVVRSISSGAPADWLAANGGTFPNAPGCPEPSGGTTAQDPVMLSLFVRVPTNAQSFSLNTYFLSSEYPEWVCSAFNDFFLVLLDSSYAGNPPNPSDGNLAQYYSSGGTTYPVGVNLATGSTGLFQACQNGPTGCGSGAVQSTNTTCASTAELTNTGFDVQYPPPAFTGDPGYCGSSFLSGGGTSWLTTAGNVVPGEVIELRFVLWDTGDGYYDSVALLDNFQWGITPSAPGTSGL